MLRLSPRSAERLAQGHTVRGEAKVGTQPISLPALFPILGGARLPQLSCLCHDQETITVAHTDPTLPYGAFSPGLGFSPEASWGLASDHSFFVRFRSVSAIM